jgi:hypothetical protein
MPQPTHLRIGCNVLFVSGASGQVDPVRRVSVSEVLDRNRNPTTDKATILAPGYMPGR